MFHRLPAALFALSLFLFSPSAAPAADSISADGPVVWKFQTGKEITAAPVVDRGVVYCGSTNGSFFALDESSGKRVWQFDAPFPLSTRAAIQGDTVCLVSGNQLIALDRADGHERWHFVAQPYRPIFSMDLTDYHRSSPVIADGVVYFGDDWGNLNGLDLASGKPVFRYTTETARPIRATPAIAQGVVCFGDWEGDVYAVRLSDQKLLWQHRDPGVRPYYGAVVSEFRIQDGVVYFGSQHDSFAPLALATGTPVWRYTDPSHTYLPSTPLLHDGKVILGTTIFANAVLCLDQGRVLWNFKADGIFFTAPVVGGPSLVVVSSNFGGTGYLYLLDFASGKLVSRLAIERATPSSPALADGKIFLGAGDGCLYALDFARLASGSPASAPTAAP